MFYLSERTLSKIFWEKLYESPVVSEAQRDVAKILKYTRKIREHFPAGSAGTISSQSAEQLWLIARYFSPKHIFEIGTFIGRSSFSLLAGSGATLDRIDSCDATFDQFFIPDEMKQDFSNAQKLNYHPKSSSVKALNQILSLGLCPDFIFIDGRLCDDDIALFHRLDPKNTIYVFDDFDGIEKGVENCILLRKRFPELLLIRPNLDHSIGCGQISILFPPSRVMLSRQQDLPVSLQL